MKEAKALLENNKSTFITAVKFSIQIGDDTEELTQKDFEYTYNIDEVLNQIKSNEESTFPSSSTESTGTTGVQEINVKATVTDKSVQKNVDAIVEEYNTEAVDAYVSDFHPYAEKRFDYVGEVSGRAVDGDSLKTKILDGFKSGKNYCDIEADVEEVEAEVTEDFLKENIVKLGSYETYSTNTENGTTNMKISLEACNGSIIDPGETWSFNDCTGDSNLESNGYKSAHVISEGKIIDGIGGGICQDYQMFLECKVDGYTLYATFWGYQDPSYDEIKTSNEMKNNGGSTYSVRAWRIYYKDGQKVDEEELPSSTYDSDNGVIFYPADTDDHEKTDDDNDDVQTYNESYNEEPESSQEEPETVPETEPAAESETEASVVTESVEVQTEAQAETVAQ